MHAVTRNSGRETTQGALPASVSVFDFQEVNFLCTFSTRSINCYLPTLPCKRGSPRYLPRSKVRDMPLILLSLMDLLLAMLGEMNNLDFKRLIVWPDMSQKYLRSSIITLQVVTLAWPKRIRSSTKKRCETGPQGKHFWRL